MLTDQSVLSYPAFRKNCHLFMTEIQIYQQISLLHHLHSYRESVMGSWSVSILGFITSDLSAFVHKTYFFECRIWLSGNFLCSSTQIPVREWRECQTICKVGRCGCVLFHSECFIYCSSHVTCRSEGVGFCARLAQEGSMICFIPVEHYSGLLEG